MTMNGADNLPKDLKKKCLQLGTDILYVDALGDYYLKETINITQ